MKHVGKARRAAFKLILFSFILLVIVLAAGVLAIIGGAVVMASSVILVSLWVLFAIFTLFFFRDPTPRVPAGAKVVVSPAHAKVDVIDTTHEPYFMKGDCRRISMFLSVFDVHVQNAPVTGKITLYRYSQGEFLNALRTECASCNENLLLGFDALEPAGRKLAVRLIAGAIARRIVAFAKEGDEVTRGDRISLIQFGSRAEVYLPLEAKIKVKLGDKVVGGQTVIAEFD